MTVKEEKKKEKLKVSWKAKIGLDVKTRGREKINLNVRIGISNEGALVKKRGISPIPPRFRAPFVLWTAYGCYSNK